MNSATSSNCDRLLSAVLRGKTNEVCKLISDGADVNTQRISDGVAPLHAASLKGYANIAKLLLRQEPFETKDVNGCTPLWYAASNGHENVVKLLLERGAETNAVSNDNCSCLLAAVLGGYVEVVRVLLSFGVDVNTQRSDDVSPLHIACQKGYLDIVKLLLYSHAQIECRDISGCTPLWHAAASGMTGVIDVLIEWKADVKAINYNRHSPLNAAIGNSHTETAVTLLQRYPQVEQGSIYHQSLLICLNDMFKGREKQIQTLLKQLRTHGTPQFTSDIFGLMADVYLGLKKLLSLINDSSPAESAEKREASERYVEQTVYSLFQSSFAWSKFADESIRAVLPPDRNLNSVSTTDAGSYSGSEIDIVAMVTMFTELVVTLYRYKDDLDTSSVPTPVDSRCNASTFAACENVEATKILLEKGAAIEAENTDGIRILHGAVRRGRVEIIKLLVQYRANIDAADIFGNTSLHEAVCHGLEVVQLLVESGARLNVQNMDGKTPLHIAVERQMSDVIVYLLDQNVDVTLTDVWRNTALHHVSSEHTAALKTKLATFLKRTNQDIMSLRNAVGVSVSKHVAAHIAPFLDSPVRPCSHQEVAAVMYVDCQGNTPLHHAVGVYGRQKMFRIGSNVSEYVNFLVERGADVNAQNKDGLIPLHVARGQKAIEACLRHANDRSFTITDKQGRNFWHLLFLLRTEDEVETTLGLLHDAIRVPSAKTTGACLRMHHALNGKFEVDYLHRTPLHYACMRTGSWSECKGFEDTFFNVLACHDINKRDTFGRTACHYAAIFGNRRLLHLLETKNADDEIQDNYAKTAGAYLRMHHAFLINMSQLRLKVSSGVLARHSCCIQDTVGQCFAERSDNMVSAHCSSVLGSTIGKLKRCGDTSVLGIYHGCRINYSDEQLRTASPLDAVPPAGCSSQTLIMFEAIKSRMDDAMVILAREVSAQDSRFVCEVIHVGSAHEGTRIGCCDEFDYNFVLTDLSKCCKVCYSPESPAGFVQLKAQTSDYDKILFNDNGTVNTRIVKFHFEALVKRVLSSTKFCEETALELVDQFKADGLPGGMVSTKLHTCIKLAFTGPVNGHHVQHNISADIVPALRISDWWPSDARKKEICEAGDCLIVFTQPQDKYPWIGWTEPHGFISFARAESRLLRERPQVVKAAYMVVKRMSKYFCQYDFFPSHVIKTALLWCLDEDSCSNYSRSSGGSDEFTEDELLRLVRMILQRLLCFAAQDFVPCYFMSQCHQPVWEHERHLKQCHLRMFQHGLAYDDLFSLTEEQSHDQLLQHTKETFVFSHIMYWSMLSDTEKLKFFVPSNINPFWETSYPSICDPIK